MGKQARKLKPTHGERNCEWIEAYCRIPEGQFVGQPVRLRPWQREIVCGIYDSPTRRAIISFGRKNAKALALDTPIPTVAGWRTIADVAPGDWVFGSDGRPCQVMAVSEVFADKRCYRLGFSDGSHIVASGDHLWQTTHRFRPWANARVNGSGNGGRRRTDVLTTDQIAASLLVSRYDGKLERNHKVPVAGPLVTADVDLPVDPYLLGAWLGDGTTASAAITVGPQDDQFLLEQLEATTGRPLMIRRYKDRAARINLSGGHRQDCLQARLRRMGLLGNKHIPERYFAAGTAQRWALLQGLMDTDGTVNRCGGHTTARCSFSSTDERLAADVWRLCRSLGLKASRLVGDAKIGNRVIGAAYRVEFAASADEPVFRMPRKQALLPATIGKRSRTLTIRSCETVPSVPTKCLMVDSPDRLFLAGHGCVPTHNTTLSALLLLLHLCGPEARANSQLYSAAQSRDQAALLFSLATKMVRLSPDLRQYVSVRDTAKQLYCAEIGTLYRALSAEATTAYGLSPVFVVHDELGQVRGPRSELYEALETAAGAQEHPLSLVISTQAPTDADLLSVLIDDAKTGADRKVKLWLWSAPDDADPFAEETIRVANPAYGDFLNAAEVMDQAASARRMPAREASYRNLVLNQRINMTNPFIARAAWEACGGEVDESVFERGAWIGVDLSARNDLTALVVVGRDDAGRWHCRAEFFAPELGVTERSARDRVPYDLWARDGWITLTPGGSVDYAFVAQRLCALADQYDVRAIPFDRWRLDVLQGELRRLNRELPIVPFGQGFRDMTPALDALEHALIESRVRHGGNPVLRMCAQNAVATRDAAGNRKLDKAKATGRIDGLVAMAMAMGRAVVTNDPVLDISSFIADPVIA